MKKAGLILAAVFFLIAGSWPMGYAKNSKLDNGDKLATLRKARQERANARRETTQEKVDAQIKASQKQIADEAAKAMQGPVQEAQRQAQEAIKQAQEASSTMSGLGSQ